MIYLERLPGQIKWFAASMRVYAAANTVTVKSPPRERSGSRDDGSAPLTADARIPARRIHKVCIES